MTIQTPGAVRSTGRALAFVACATAVLSGDGQPSTTGDGFDDLYRRGQQVNAKLESMTARFTETTTSSLLTRPLVSHGTVAVQRPTRVVMNYTEPEVRVLLIDGKRLIMSWPGRSLRQAKDIGAAVSRVQRYFVDSSPAGLREHFTIDARQEGSGARRHHVTMTPTRRQIRDGLTRLELWLDPESLLLSSMRLTFPNGDTKLLEFEDVVPNAAIDPAVFTAGR